MENLLSGIICLKLYKGSHFIGGELILGSLLIKDRFNGISDNSVRVGQKCNGV